MQHILPAEEVPLDFVLLDGIDEDVRPRVISCLQARVVGYDAGDVIFRSSESYLDVAFLLEGSAEGFVYDERGNRSILHIFTPGQVISYGTLFGGWTPAYDVAARTDLKVVLFNTDHLPMGCDDHSVRYANQVIANLAASVARLNEQIMTTLEVRTRRTLRGKILAFLEMESRRQGSTSIDIAMSRQELADYLGVDRAALSRELSNLREEGQFAFHRSRFELSIRPPKARGSLSA